MLHETLEELRKVIYDLTGNYYPNERLTLLEKKLNIANLDAQTLLKNKQLTQEILDIVTVPETRFFREEIQLHTFINHCLDKLPRHHNDPITVASYACATGQEPYTLAMLLESANVPYKIYAFDINERYLQKTRDGVYPKRTFAEIPDVYRKYVNIEGEYIRVIDKLKSKVEFKHLNLIKKEDFLPYIDKFDAAFCRNALIYFDDNSKPQAINNISHTLKRGGYFIVSITEILTDLHTKHFTDEKVNGVYLQEKITINYTGKYSL
jgi:chemotaxis protein methyltransferase CheR